MGTAKTVVTASLALVAAGFADQRTFHDGMRHAQDSARSFVVSSYAEKGCPATFDGSKPYNVSSTFGLFKQRGDNEIAIVKNPGTDQITVTLKNAGKEVAQPSVVQASPCAPGSPLMGAPRTSSQPS